MHDLRLERRKQKRSKKRRKQLLYSVIFLIVIIIGIGSYLLLQTYNSAKDSYSGLDRPGGKSELRSDTVKIGEDPISILLMGIENYSSGGKNGRADTQIVVTLNPDTNKMTMTSIPRDTRVDLPTEAVGQENAGSHKINAAYTYASLSGYSAPKLTVETVENLLDIPIDEYAVANFEGFRDIVNALGGVTVDIKKGFWEKNIYNNDKRIYFTEGTTNLSGEEALAFVRMRKRAVNNTYPRDERQRQFIKAAISEAISVGTIFKVGEITDILGEHVKSSLKPAEIYALEKEYSSIDATAIKTFEISGSNHRVNGISFFIPTDQDLAEISRKLKKELGLPADKVQDE
ncbi:transcriptional attenuator, LytR family [Virgibacillus subterraneus]|uniref:Transcriptional attenuator, LytR family n=1 Tax=Virgibacillus subterraneus TaxID=621109 RepID=A0A1H9L059_9BACI|nr:LCP family protein [Virgibacillus subterraneus]SER04760.1 transcriptional attenuator, LytR family [Virgibacillus subterraneus]